MITRFLIYRSLINNIRPNLLSKKQNVQNFISKRGSGHNAMRIEPSSYEWTYLKDKLHLHSLITLIPLSVMTVLINIRANPELSEIPEGYEPRHWEYYKHPVTRWLARYVLYTDELEHEMKLSYLEKESESIIFRTIERNVRKVMSFYNDHRSNFFMPAPADDLRVTREYLTLQVPFSRTQTNALYDNSRDPKKAVVPVEGYHKPFKMD